jgi:hypothetical protein
MNHLLQYVAAVALAALLVFNLDALALQARSAPRAPQKTVTKTVAKRTVASTKRTIASKKRTVASKKRTVASKKRTVATKKVSTKRTVASKKRTVASKKRTIASKKSRRHKVARARSKAPKVVHANDLFMWRPPSVKLAAMNKSSARHVNSAFESGMAARYSPLQLVQAGAFTDKPLLGGIFKRREPVKFIVMHSTETERPASGPRVIQSWNRGMRHPGAQYVVDRDGKIYQTVDPAYATVHVNVSRTLNGVNNDNSIGIEIVRAGKQKYTADQLESVTRLVAYLQNRFAVTDSGIVGHGQIQPSTRTDPVNFNWNNFKISLSMLKLEASGKRKETQS